MTLKHTNKFLIKVKINSVVKEITQLLLTFPLIAIIAKGSSSLEPNLYMT